MIKRFTSDAKTLAMKIQKKCSPFFPFRFKRDITNIYLTVNTRSKLETYSTFPYSLKPKSVG